MLHTEVAAAFEAIGRFLATIGKTFYAAGVHLMAMLADGMKAAALAPIHAVASVAEHIKNFFVGHSPLPVGPLHELNRVRILQTIAGSVRPAPMVEAIRRVAQVAAIAVPMAIAAPAGAALAAPAFAGSLRAGASAAAAPVTIHYTVNINGGSVASGDDLRRALDEHAHDLVSIIGRELATRNRTKFSE